MKLNRADSIKAKEIAEKYNIDIDVVKLVILSQYEFIKEKTRDLNFEEGLTKEEFSKLKTNFNIPSIGKLYASYFMYRKISENKKKKLG